jgi:hypothetical protein
MHLWSQATVDIHHAALSSLLRPLRLRPPGQHSELPRGATGFALILTVPNDWPTPSPLKGPGASDDDGCCLGLPCGVCEGAQHDLTAILTMIQASPAASC